MARAQKRTSNAYAYRDNVVPIGGRARNYSNEAKKKMPKKSAAKRKSSLLKAGRLYKKATEQKSLDRGLLLDIIIMVIFGLIMVFSASAPSASAYKGTAYYYIIRQGIFAVIGFAAMGFMSLYDYHRLTKFSVPLLIGSFVLLLSVYTPLGVVVNNARRWINLGFTTLQPTEVVKMAIIIFFAHSLSTIKEKITEFRGGLLRYLLILGLFIGVILLEPHLSASLVIVGTAGIMLLLAGAKIKHFLVMGAFCVPVLVGYVLKNPYQISRIVNMDPFKDASDSGFQVANSLYAIGSGGVFGLGLGQSRQKFLYLPEPQNDFIFAIIGEELGLIGCLFVIALFVYLIWKGYRIAQQAPDRFGMLLASGITTLIAIQVTLNIAVATASAPATGVALPFFSYGGTSLCILMCSMGILLNISRQTVGKKRIDDEDNKK